MNIQSKVDITKKEKCAKEESECTDVLGRTFCWDEILERYVETPWTVLCPGNPNACAELSPVFQKRLLLSLQGNAKVPGMPVDQAGRVGVSIVAKGVLEEESVLEWIASLVCCADSAYFPNHPFFSRLSPASFRTALQGVFCRKSSLNTCRTLNTTGKDFLRSTILDEAGRAGALTKSRSREKEEEGKDEDAGEESSEEKGRAGADLARTAERLIDIEGALEQEKIPRSKCSAFSLLEGLKHMPEHKKHAREHRREILSQMEKLGYVFYGKQLVKKELLAQMQEAVQKNPYVHSGLSALKGSKEDRDVALLLAVKRGRRKEILKRIAQVYQERGVLLPSRNESVFVFAQLVQSVFPTQVQMRQELAYYQIDLHKEYQALKSKHTNHTNHSTHAPINEEDVEEGEIV
ncbi:hypothetical protein NECID01_2028 [Nematocida sp. AWRm77]|nr:hypothetical protein NECID01_2028 [Nematocida sp. AWRm77]